MSHSYSCHIFDDSTSNEIVKFQSRYLDKMNLELMNKNYSYATVITMKLGDKYGSSYVNHLPIAINFAVISFLLNLLIFFDILYRSHLVIFASR